MKRVALFQLAREYGGAEKVVENLYNLNNSKSIEMYLICLDDTKFSDVLKKDFKIDNILFLPNNKFAIFTIIKETVRFIRKNEIDILHVHNVASEVIASIIAVCTKVRVITTIHSFIDYDFSGFLKRNIYKAFRLIANRLNDKYVTVSEGLKISLPKSIRKKTEVIYNGISEFGLKTGLEHNERFTICSIGRLVEVKAHSKLLGAIKILKEEGIDVDCIIAGEGVLENELKEYVNKNGLGEQVHFCGFIGDIQSIFSKSDIYIVHSNMEGLPLSTMEAMSYGIPIIAYRVGGLKELLNRTTCVEIENNDCESIAKAIKYAMNNGDITKSNVVNAREVYERRFSLEAFNEKYLKLYKLE
ncbi:glycosyltransferase family 4 protein [Clostridium sp. LP20]|uniref:glycosyltransferase family 4 protein n=1 Tax=Clostridium sp. LP20 TaxID=3418665 RepID=UPI003EE42714